MERTRLVLPAALLTVIQVIHGAIPAETDAEGYVGLVVGALFVIASIAALVGAVKGREWARPLLGVTGLAVAIGFVLYHVTPYHSSFTNPYFGEDKIGPAQWTPVVLCVAIGLWCAYEAFVRTEDAPATLA
jgi:hypothetical protein